MPRACSPFSGFTGKFDVPQQKLKEYLGRTGNSQLIFRGYRELRPGTYAQLMADTRDYDRSGCRSEWDYVFKVTKTDRHLETTYHFTIVTPEMPVIVGQQPPCFHGYFALTERVIDELAHL